MAMKVTLLVRNKPWHAIKIMRFLFKKGDDGMKCLMVEIQMSKNTCVSLTPMDVGNLEIVQCHHWCSVKKRLFAGK
jgi:hypothetical protein